MSPQVVLQQKPNYYLNSLSERNSAYGGIYKTHAMTEKENRPGRKYNVSIMFISTEVYLLFIKI